MIFPMDQVLLGKLLMKGLKVETGMNITIHAQAFQ